MCRTPPAGMGRHGKRHDGHRVACGPWTEARRLVPTCARLVRARSRLVRAGSTAQDRRTRLWFGLGAFCGYESIARCGLPEHIDVSAGQHQERRGKASAHRLVDVTRLRRRRIAALWCCTTACSFAKRQQPEVTAQHCTLLVAGKECGVHFRWMGSSVPEREASKPIPAPPTQRAEPHPQGTGGRLRSCKTLGLACASDRGRPSPSRPPPGTRRSTWLRGCLRTAHTLLQQWKLVNL